MWPVGVSSCSGFRNPSTSLHRHDPVGSSTAGTAIAYAGQGQGIAFDLKGVHSLCGTVAAFRILNGHFPAFNGVFSLDIAVAVGTEIYGIRAIP